MMEMELNELVRFIAYRYAAAGRIVHLNRMPVIDDLQRRRVIGECNGWQRLLFGMKDVDGRLRLAESASCADRRPVIGTSGARVTPGMALLGQCRRNARQEQSSDNPEQRRSADHGFLLRTVQHSVRMLASAGDEEPTAEIEFKL